jgi:hypothetical protein
MISIGIRVVTQMEGYMPKKTEDKKPRETTPKDLLADFQKTNDEQFILYDITMRIKNRISGGRPLNLEFIYAMIDARMKKNILTEEEADRIKAETVKRYNEMYAEIMKRDAEEKGDDPEDTELPDPEVSPEARAVVESRWVTFWQDAKGVYLEARTVKAALRECHSVLNTFVEGKKVRKKSGHNDGTYVEGLEDHVDRVYVYREGSIIPEPDRYEDMVVHLKTAQGPRAALKRVDLILGEDEIEGGADVRFRLKLHVKSSITEADLISAFQLMQDKGLGAMASTGSGKSRVTEFNRVGLAAS